MLHSVKEFIEHNVDLLDSNPQEFFLRGWEENKLDSGDIGYMCAILSEAGFLSEDINKWREGALLQILDTEIADWGLADGGVSSMPVYDFIDVFLNNRVGFDEDYVLHFIEDHSSRWKRFAQIKKERYLSQDITVIARH